MTTKSVAKVLDILEVVCRSGTALDLRQVSDELDLPSPIMFRLMLQTLVQYGYVRQECSTRKFSAGLKIFELSLSVISDLQFTEIAREPLRRLAVGRIAARIVVVGGQAMARPVMVLSLTCDHRTVLCRSFSPERYS